MYGDVGGVVWKGYVDGACALLLWPSVMTFWSGLLVESSLPV